MQRKKKTSQLQQESEIVPISKSETTNFWKVTLMGDLSDYLSHEHITQVLHLWTIWEESIIFNGTQQPITQKIKPVWKSYSLTDYDYGVIWEGIEGPLKICLFWFLFALYFWFKWLHFST